MKIPIKEIAIYILVTLTLFWTLSFYLLLTTDSDTRLLEITQQNASPPTIILYLEKISFFKKEQANSNNFGLYKVDSKQTSVRDSCNGVRKGILIINAAPIDPGRTYVDFLSQMEKLKPNNSQTSQGSSSCSRPDVFILKRNAVILMSNDDQIARYSQQISEAIRHLTHVMRYQISILAYHQAAQLVFNLMLQSDKQFVWGSQSQPGSISRVVFINLVSPFARIEYDPPYKWLQNMKKKIAKQKYLMEMMNEVPLVIISSHKESNKFEHSYKLLMRNSLGQLFQFKNTNHVSTREIHNLRYHMSDSKSLVFTPLTSILAQFFMADFKQKMSADQVQEYFKYGHVNEDFKAKRGSLEECDFIQLEDEDTYDQFFNENEKIWKFNQSCLQIFRSQAIQEDYALLIYSRNMPFTILSDTRSPLPPYDNLTSSTIYLFERLPKVIFVVNPHHTDVMISLQRITTPLNPLNLSDMEVEYMSQVMFTHYWVVRVCPSQLLLFPLHFPGGSFRRGFLLDKQSQSCYQERGPIEHFVEDFFLNWALERNIIILTLLISTFLQNTSKNRLILQFFANYLLLFNTTCTFPFLSSIYVLSFSILLEAVISLIAYVCERLVLTDRRGVYACWALFGICVGNEWISLISTWKIFLTAVLLFLNKNNITLLLLKIYFIFDDLRYNIPNHTALILLLFWLYVTLPYYQNSLETDRNALQFQKNLLGVLIIASAATIEMSGAVLEHLIGMYLRVIVVIRIIKILKS